MNRYLPNDEPEVTWGQWLKLLGLELLRLVLTLGVIGLWAFILWAGAQ